MSIMSSMNSVATCLAFLILFQYACARAQELRLLRQQQNLSLQQPTTRAQTLIITQNPSGQGVRVIDRSTNRQLVDTENMNSLERNDNEIGGTAQGELNEGLVAGLLDWFEKLKEKKRKKKEENKQPIILPVPIKPEKQERKEIHIHINNHIKKHDQHKHKKHEPHERGKKKKHHHGHYEDYHEGHYDHDDHDKHYHGKHSYPLLGHHFDWGFDYFGGHYGFDQHHGGHYGGGGGGGHHDDYSGYESKKVARFASKPKPASAPTKRIDEQAASKRRAKTTAAETTANSQRRTTEAQPIIDLSIAQKQQASKLVAARIRDSVSRSFQFH